MGSFVYDCPHCGTVKSGFSARAQFPCTKESYTFAVAAICNNCTNPVYLMLYSPHASEPLKYQGNLLDSSAPFVFRNFIPAVAPKETPDGVPSGVAKAFDQAAASRRSGHYDAACGMYRRAMELGLKAFSPEVEAWKLEKRIDKMAALNKITPEIQAWAHELRLDGNDALHGDEEATVEMADQMHGLCRFLLLYLYTLPLQVEAAKARRDLG